jgi:Fur family ferric uptake transcriptional regulator
MPHCQTLIESLRLQGRRITPQREMIVQAVAHANQHLTAEEVYRVVRERSHAVNLATIYRTLDLLVEHGLASRLDLGQGQVVYATRQHGPHIHLVCRQCGEVIDADHQLVLAAGQHIQAQYNFTADLQHISVSGLCANCLEATNSS